MINETIVALGILASVNSTQPVISQSAILAEERVLAKKELDLTNRLPTSGNEVFSDNILLSLHYLKGDVKEMSRKGSISSPSDIDWEKVRKDFEVSFTLKKGEVFAFHRLSLEKFENSIVASTNSNFIHSEGYKTLAGLAGNGVCHIASLINWTAKEAGPGGLDVISMVDHDFAPIPDIPQEFGASIYSTSREQNLYIRNNFEYPVTFKFVIENNKVKLIITS